MYILGLIHISHVWQAVQPAKHCLPKAFSYLDLGSTHAFLLRGVLVQIGAGPPKRMRKKGWAMYAKMSL